MEKAIKNLHSIHFRWAMRRLNKMIPKSFVPEKNKLETWNNLKKLNGNEVEVGMLVGVDKEETLANAGPSFKLPGYNWVFVWDEFKERCGHKGINIEFDKDDFVNSIKENLHRLCLLMGLDTIKNGQKIALCKMTVKIENLFRPAYNTKVTETITKKEKEQMYSLSLDTNSENKDEIESWLARLQANNEYPWTRMGYTYDCAASEDQNDNDGTPAYIGLSEFILMPNSEVKNVKLYPEKGGLWDYSSAVL